MIGSLIGGALQLGSTVFGGLKASQAMKKVKGNLEGSRNANQAWYDRRYNEDATQRADARRILTMTQDALRDRNREARAASAVSGGTEESVAAQRKVSADAMADAASRIAVAGEARKDDVERQYMQRDAQIEAQLNDLERGKAGAVSDAVKGVGSVGAGIAGSFK